jgi:ADP-ribose pyrophosphatase YjhB (NUDIX family)
MVQVAPEQKVDKVSAEVLKNDYVEVRKGEYLSNSEWAHLSKADQELVTKEGLVAFQDINKLPFTDSYFGSPVAPVEVAKVVVSPSKIVMTTTNQRAVELDNGELMLLSMFNDMPPEEQRVAMAKGVSGLNAWYKEQVGKPLTPKQQQELQKNAGTEYIKTVTGEFAPSTGVEMAEVYVVTGKGEMIKKSALEKMDERYKTILVQNGYDAYDKALNMEFVKIPTVDGKEQLIKNADFYALPPSQQYILLNKGFDGLDQFIAEEEKALEGYSYKNEDGTSDIDILLALRVGGERGKQAVENLYSAKQIEEVTKGQIVSVDMDKITKPHNFNEFREGASEWLFLASEVIANPTAIQKTASKISEFVGDLPKTAVEILPQLKVITDTVSEIDKSKNAYIDEWQKQNPKEAKIIETKRAEAEKVLGDVNAFGKNVGVYAGYVGQIVKTAFNETGGALAILADETPLGQAAKFGGSAVRVIGGATTGGIELVGVVPATLIGAAISVGSDVALSQIGKGKTAEKATQDGIETTMGLVLGLGSFFASRPQMMAKDPEFEITYTAAMVLSPEKIIKVGDYLKTAVDPRVSNWEAISLNIDVARPKPARGMSTFELTQRVDESIKQIVKQADAAVPELLRTGHDVVIKDPVSGKTVAHLSGIERVSPTVMFSSSPGKFSEIKEMLNNEGKYDAKYVASEMIRNKLPGWEKALGMEFNAPQPNATFLAGAHMAGTEIGNPVIKAKIFSPKDYRSVPAEVLKLSYEGKVESAKQLLADMNNNGLLEPGIYPIPKWYGKGSGTVEFEMVDTQVYKPIQNVPWWAKDKTSNTAITYTKSPMRSVTLSDMQRSDVFNKFKEKFKVELMVDAATGNYKVARLNESYKGKTEFSPEQAANKVGVKVAPQLEIGQKVPIVWMISENAIAEGRGIPSLTNMYKAEAFGALTELRKGSPIGGLKEVRETTSDIAEGMITDAQFKSVAAVTTESPGWAKGSRDSMVAGANKLVAEGKLETWARERGTALVLDKKTGKIFYTRSKGERLGSPGGGLESGETAIAALAREMKEETGLTAIKAQRIGRVKDPNPIISDKTGDPVFMGGKLMYNNHHAYMVLVEDVSKAKLGSDLIESSLKTVKDARKPSLLRNNQLEPYSEKILEKVTDKQIDDFINGKTGLSISSIKASSKPVTYKTPVPTKKGMPVETIGEAEVKIKRYVKPKTPFDVAKDIKATSKYSSIVVEKVPVEKILGERIAAERISTEKMPYESMMFEKTPSERTPAEKTPTEKTPVEKTPTEKTPMEKTPVEKTPAEKTPAEKTPFERIPFEPVPKTPPPKTVIKTSKLKFEDLTSKQLEGAIAWKQGFIYKLWTPPYGQSDIINTKEPIPGVKYYDGPGSAAKSIVVKYGEIPQHVKRDMGVVDIDVFRSKEGGKPPTMKFKPDSKQKTKYSGIVSVSSKDTGGNSEKAL